MKTKSTSPKLKLEKKKKLLTCAGCGWKAVGLINGLCTSCNEYKKILKEKRKAKQNQKNKEMVIQITAHPNGLIFGLTNRGNVWVLKIGGNGGIWQDNVITYDLRIP